ncbi:hypothetical protein ACSHWO_34630 [Streptomyces sp. HUAS TT3]|uniref:hypothetical protein n=1 Tax=Streptomyces sp. HUAS TT3 TaxID=3447510 RepID=UPI003F657716
MRKHLAALPDLRRLRHREQPGASNLPAPRREATTEQVEAARLWPGNETTPRDMSDDQLAAAMRSNLLDDRVAHGSRPRPTAATSPPCSPASALPDG